MSQQFSMNLAGRPVGDGNPAFIIAEVAQAHEGSLGMAHAFVDAIADSGADAVKFQTHIAAAESTLDEPFRVQFSRQDETRLDYWKRMEFTAPQWRGLAEHANQRGLVFLSSAFSLAAVAILNDIGVPAWKIGSGEFASRELWQAMADTGKPILFSTGLSTKQDTANAVSVFRDNDLEFALLQCTSLYPVPLEEVGLNVMDELRSDYGCVVGLSDHSGSVWPGLAALSRGADILEVHVTFHRGMFGPDVRASVTFDELRLLCGMRDALVAMNSHPVDKDEVAARMQPMRDIFGRSLAPIRPISAGAILSRDMLTVKKPAGGISAEDAEAIVGRRLARDVTPDRILRWSDVTEDDT